MKLTFATWNISVLNRLRDQAALLRHIYWDVLALQEINQAAFEHLVAKVEPTAAVFSLRLPPRIRTEAKRRRCGCAILTRKPFTIRSSGLLKAAPLPERALFADLDAGNRRLQVWSVHVPPGVNWGQRKPETFVAVAKALAALDGPALVGIDANAPKTDHPDIRQNEWWWDEEPDLLGPKPLHPLRDVLRDHLGRHPERLRLVRQLRPSGPLEVSHLRGSVRKVPCRYDFILASPHFTVADVKHLYQDAVAAGSDHALVTAELSITSWTAASSVRPPKSARMPKHSQQPQTGVPRGQG